jgi:hypothetical protein
MYVGKRKNEEAYPGLAFTSETTHNDIIAWTISPGFCDQGRRRRPPNRHQTMHKSFTKPGRS